MKLVRSACVLATLVATQVTAVRAGGETGHAFVVPVHAKGSARAAYREAVGDVGFSDFKVTSALSDRSDRFVEGFFRARYRGGDVAGIMFAGTGGRVGGIFDSTAAFPHSEPALLQRLARLGGGGAGGSSGAQGGYAPRPLHTVSFESGTVALPDGWVVTGSYKGCVEAQGPSDHGYIGLGCPQFVQTPSAGYVPRGVLVAPYGSPVQAFIASVSAPRPVGFGFRDVTPVEVQQIQPLTPGGQAVYMLYDYTSVLGIPCRGFELVNITPPRPGSFGLYTSGFVTRKADFARLAPTLWRSWKSWTVNQSVFSERLASAAQSMREAGQILEGMASSASHASEGSNKGFDQYLRDTATVEETTTGRRYEGNYQDAAAIVHYDPTKYQILSGSQLAP